MSNVFEIIFHLGKLARVSRRPTIHDVAREAGVCYVTIALATDYDCWREDGDAVDVAQVVAQMQDNAELARKAVELFCRSLPRQRTPSPIDRALDNAVITAPDKRDRGAMTRLDAIAGRVISQG